MSTFNIEIPYNQRFIQFFGFVFCAFLLSLYDVNVFINQVFSTVII